jgi:hypothetical protein
LAHLTTKAVANLTIGRLARLTTKAAANLTAGLLAHLPTKTKTVARLTAGPSARLAIGPAANPMTSLAALDTISRNKQKAPNPGLFLMNDGRSRSMNVGPRAT